jgi:lipopolysaccharide/colanic/teichoic acid biosynthesis glycosyltransferase
LASSILYSNTGGRLVTALPEVGVESGSSPAHNAASESTEREQQTLFGSDQTAWYREDGSVISLPSIQANFSVADISQDLPSLSWLPTHARKYVLGKRVFDVILAIVIFPIVALAIVVIGALISLTSEGPIFFRQRRIGQHGREFFIWKFRTMRPRADWILAEYLKRNPAARDEWHLSHKLRMDPRITPFGRMLRKTSLDELPQIFNILIGDMSFVGPRPIVRAESLKYAKRFPYYLAAVPGITGLWQVSGRNDVSYEARTLLDETYVSKWTVLKDLWILLKTPRAVINRNGAY